MGVLSWLGIQPKQFRFTLTVGATSYVLPNAPIGWEEGILRWSRSEFYYGMIRSFTVPLQFVLDGAWILRTQFYTQGLKAQTSLLIEELVPETWAYQTVFFGDMDYSTYKDSLNTVECTVMEGGITAQIKAYEAIKYTIPLDIPDAIDLKLTGIRLQESAVLYSPPGIDYPITLNNQVLFELQAIQNESQSNVPNVQAVQWQSLGAPPAILTNRTDWFYQASESQNITITGNYDLQNFAAYIRDQTGTIVQTVVESVGSRSTATFSYTFAVVAGYRYFLTGTTFIVGIPPSIYEMTFNISYSSVAASTFCKAVSAKYLYTELISRMNGSAYPIQSLLLDAWSTLYITSGNAIRGLDNPTLITSFKDFFTSINAVSNAGFGIESGKAVLEKKSYFFKANLQAANVGENKAFELELYEPYVYNSVKIGYPDQQFATIVNGRDEVNSTQIYSLPITRVQKELDLLSIYRADAYGIEDLRITKQDGDTINNNNDNNVFMIKVIQPVSGEYQPERTEGYISLTGVLAGDTYYNYDLSPHRNLERHGDYLHSILDKYDSSAIIFESALKNASMSVVYNNGQRTTENSNISVGILPAKFFLPYLITILTKLPKNMMNLIDNFPTGYIKSRFWENEQRGFTIDTTVDVSKNSERELKLLLTPDNELTNLIH